MKGRQAYGLSLRALCAAIAPNRRCGGAFAFSLLPSAARAASSAVFIKALHTALFENFYIRLWTFYARASDCIAQAGRCGIDSAHDLKNHSFIAYFRRRGDGASTMNVYRENPIIFVAMEAVDSDE
jgi:hypothetical protein